MLWQQKLTVWKNLSALTLDMPGGPACIFKVVDPF